MPPLDLLVMNPVSTLGGSERVVFQVARGAYRAGLHSRVLFKSPIERPEMLSWYEPYGIQASASSNFKPTSPKRILSAMLAFRMEIRALEPTAVNLHNPGNTILASDVLALRLAGVKRVVCSLHHPLDPATLPRSWKLSTKIASRWADAITVTTPVLRDTVEAMGVQRSKMTIVPLAVEPLKRDLSRAEGRKELDLPAEAFVVGSLGRMVANKRMDAVIRACAAAKGFQERGMLVLAGGGEEEENLRALSAELLPGRHRFYGHLPDPSAFYASLDLFALPSELEGFGLVYPEAGLAGVPSVGSNAGGAPYAIQDGVTGYLLPVDQPEGLREIVEAGLTDPSKLLNLGAAAKAFAQSDLAIETFERRMLELLFPSGLTLRQK